MWWYILCTCVSPFIFSTVTWGLLHCMWMHQIACVHFLSQPTRQKKKKGLSHRLLPKKLSATLFFFFFFFLGKIAMLMRFFFFFNQNIQLAYKKNNAIHSYFPFYHENFSIFSSIFAVSSVQKKKYPSPRRAMTLSCFTVCSKGQCESFTNFGAVQKTILIVTRAVPFSLDGLLHCIYYTALTEITGNR